MDTQVTIRQKNVSIQLTDEQVISRVGLPVLSIEVQTKNTAVVHKHPSLRLQLGPAAEPAGVLYFPKNFF